MHNTFAVEQPANPLTHFSKTEWIRLRAICPVYAYEKGAKLEKRLHKIPEESRIQQKNL